MARFYLESGVHNGTMRDGHTWSCSSPSRRVVADEQYGMNGKRTLGFVDVEDSDLSCIEDMKRIGASTKQTDVNLNFEELTFLAGSKEQVRVTVQSLQEQLQALLED